MKNIFLILSIILLFTLKSNVIANYGINSKLFLGANVGYNLMEFYSFDDWNKWRHDFEFKKTLALRIEYSLNKNHNLIIYSNSSYLERSTNIPLRDFPLFPTLPSKFEQRSSEISSFLINDVGLKYNINIFKNLSIFPKLGFNYAYRFNEKYQFNSEEYDYNDDNLKNNQIGFNIGGGLSYKIHDIKMILEYNFLDDFADDKSTKWQEYVFWNHIHSINFILGYEFNLGAN